MSRPARGVVGARDNAAAGAAVLTVPPVTSNSSTV
jgi:hypothetical protein